MKKPIKTKTPGKAAGKTLLIAAGGTGGHITPGISIAEAWLAEGGRIILATLMKNIEYPDIVRLARDERVTIVAYDAPRMTKNPLKLPGFLKRFFSAVRLVKQAATHEGADVVLGMGGYSSFPAVFFAVTKRKPLYLCEQNAHWGMVTRIGKTFAKAIFLSFPEERKLPAKFVVTGNPLRAMFKDLKPKSKTSSKKKKILFIGGSQGATDINSLYLSFAQSTAASKYECTIAAGGQSYQDLKAKARKNDTVLPFIEDMPAAYTSADYLVARCGSGTLFEILWSEKPAFLLPYPFAAGDHQRANALAMQNDMPCRIYDTRPFDAQAALPAFLDFLTAPPSTKAKLPDSRAETKITRYIIENLTHAQKN